MRSRYRHSCSTASIVATHEIHRPDVRRPFAPHESQLLAERVRLRGELFLQMAFDSVLLQSR
jgi:hypothetical protein